jgi:hypothetical protein
MAGAAARRGHGRDGPVDAPMEMGNTLDAQVAVERFSSRAFPWFPRGTTFGYHWFGAPDGGIEP